MLISVVRHQVDQDIRDQQDIAVKAAGKQRNRQQGQNSLPDISQLLLVHTFKKGLHGAHRSSLDHRDQGIGAVVIKVSVAVRHHTVAVGTQIPGDHHKPAKRTGQQTDTGPQFFFVCTGTMGQCPHQHIQPYHCHIHRRVLLDAQGQQSKNHREHRALPVNSVHQPQQKGQ